jgi:3-dehydroquinate dehydratase/shikimate dehydrogenase
VFLKEFESVPVDGYSVTIPHKEAAAAIASEKDETVSRTQAANTLIRRPDGYFASNTDYPALVESLIANMPVAADGHRPTLASRVVLLLGAGGVARAAAHALHTQGALVTVANRTSERASKLAAEVGCRFVEWSGRHSVVADLVINCTSVGMHPNLDETPLHHSYLKPGLTVCDLVYTPETTLLIKEAKSRGAHVITGVDMFVRQAALQFRLFTGLEPPLELIRGVVRKVLSPVTARPDEE